MGTIIAIVVISALVIISGLIAFIVISNRRNGGITRATKLSRLNGVKVLPDIVTKSTVLDCRVSFLISAITGYVGTSENTPGVTILSKYGYFSGTQTRESSGC